MKKYKLILIAPDGDYIFESENSTIEECEEVSENMGSKWFFYPFHFIIRDYGVCFNLKQRIIEPPSEFEYFKNKSLKSVIKKFKETSTEEWTEYLNSTH